MAGMLTAARVTVPESNRAAYLATLSGLKERHEARGHHLWLFELQGERGTFLEFSEGKGPGHRAEGPADATERELEERLTSLATYEGHHERWYEVPLTPKGEE